MNQRVTVDLGSAIDKLFVEFLSFDLLLALRSAFICVRRVVHEVANDVRPPSSCATEGGKGGYVSRVHHCYAQQLAS